MARHLRAHGARHDMEDPIPPNIFRWVRAMGADFPVCAEYDEGRALPDGLIDILRKVDISRNISVRRPSWGFEARMTVPMGPHQAREFRSVDLCPQAAIAGLASQAWGTAAVSRRKAKYWRQFVLAIEGSRSEIRMPMTDEELDEFGY